MPALSPQGGAAVTGTFRHGGAQPVSRRRGANEPAPALPATQGHGHARVHACNQHPGPRAGRRLHAEVLSAGRAAPGESRGSRTAPYLPTGGLLRTHEAAPAVPAKRPRPASSRAEDATSL